jgi:predicted amidophosphoribosyltransferase
LERVEKICPRCGASHERFHGELCPDCLRSFWAENDAEFGTYVESDSIYDDDGNIDMERYDPADGFL